MRVSVYEAACFGSGEGVGPGQETYIYSAPTT